MSRKVSMAEGVSGFFALNGPSSTSWVVTCSESSQLEPMVGAANEKTVCKRMPPRVTRLLDYSGLLFGVLVKIVQRRPLLRHLHHHIPVHQLRPQSTALHHPSPITRHHPVIPTASNCNCYCECLRKGLQTVMPPLPAPRTREAS